MDNALDLLDELNEEELAELEAEFDIESNLLPANYRPHEEDKKRMFETRDMVNKLDGMVKSKTESAKPTPRIAPTKTWRNNAIENKENNIRKNTKNSNTINTKRQHEKKNDKTTDYSLTAEEEELFDGIDEDELIELAALSNASGLMTQEQFHAAQMGELLLSGDAFICKPVRGPERRLKSMSDEDADLDSIMLLDNLREDTDEISCIKINNVPLELSLLQAIFEALKTTAKIKHLSLTGVSMKDEVGLMFNEAFEANKTLESLNLESNDLTNETIVPLCKILETHPTIREFKCSHQKHGGLGSRGEEALAKALDKNNQLLKISYPFKVPSSRSLADRCQIRNNEILRQKRTKGEDFYNYREEMQKRDKHPQPWVREKGDPKEEDAKLRGSLLETRRSFKKTGNPAQMRAEAKLRAQENAKPIIDDELASKLNAARGKSRSRFSAR